MSTYAIEIADRVLELLKAPTADEPTPFFKSYWRTPMRQVAASDLPLLGVYILRETRGPDGDENAGEIRFIHRLHLGIAGAISNADPASSCASWKSGWPASTSGCSPIPHSSA